MVNSADWSNPYELAEFIEHNQREADALREDIAERQRRRESGLDAAASVQHREIVNASQRPSHGSHGHSREWSAYIQRAIADGVTAQADALRIEVADVIADLAREYDRKLEEAERRLRAEYGARLQGFTAGLKMAQAEPDIVPDMSKALRPRHGTA